MIEIVLILDRSAPMASHAEDLVEGFNSCLRRLVSNQHGVKADTALTVVRFNEGYEPVHERLPLVGECTFTARYKFDEFSYIPRGRAALVDTLGRSIYAARSRSGTQIKDTQVIFVVITYGRDDASRSFTERQVLELIEEARADLNWEFLLLGATSDVLEQARELGIPPSRTACWKSPAVAFELISDKILHFQQCFRSEALELTGEDRRALATGQ